MTLKSILQNKEFRFNISVIFSLAVNGAYAAGNLIVGVVSASYWFMIMGVHFFLLCLMRAFGISALHTKNVKKKYIGRLTGLLSILLCITLIGSIVICDRIDVITPVHEIVMIAIATYTTVKTTLAVINIIKVRKTKNPVLISIRNINCVDAAVSILSMQRSMLVTFGEMAVHDIKLFNLLTGIGVCGVIVFLIMLSLKWR